tara:strand:+ start:317 stop:712 length:396 start_codon:yes stop_codon:yes gene_type:complete
MWNLLFGFVLGYLFAVFIIYILNLGRTILILKQLQYIVAAIFTYMEECMLEATLYKEMAMDESDISEKAKKARRVLNQNTIKTIQDNSMKGFLVRWPSAFDNMLDYRTWEQMKSYIEKETLKTNNKDGDNE